MKPSDSHPGSLGPLQIESEEETEALAARLAPLLHAEDLVLLTGDLGAGKTYFTGALLHRLGLDEDEPVTSPTFALACEYPTQPPALHADLYRLGSEEEVFELGLEERRAAGMLLVVEWGLPYLHVLGGDALELVFALSPRAVEFRAYGPRSQELLAAFRAGGAGAGSPCSSDGPSGT